MQQNDSLTDDCVPTAGRRQLVSKMGRRFRQRCWRSSLGQAIVSTSPGATSTRRFGQNTHPRTHTSHRRDCTPPFYPY